MATGLYRWSQTPASNASATYTWAEGMAPSSVNDSARGIMSDVAQYRDDIAGAIVTGGTATAYTVASNQVFDTLPHMDKAMLAFTPHATNGATVTLNVDGLGAKPLRTAPAVELMAGTLVQGTPYVATYNNSDSAWYLQSFFGNNPYNIPLAGGLDYWGATAPNSSFVFPFGQAISRTTYAGLFALVGVTFGAGDGSTTFNIPDKRGRASAGKGDMGGSSAFRLTSTYFGGNGDALGAVGGTESQTLSLSQLPTGIASQNTQSFAVTATSIDTNIQRNVSNNAVASGGAATVPQTNPGTIGTTGTVPVGTVISTSFNTSGAGHATVQPTIVCNYILRVI